MTDRNWDAELAKIDRQLASLSDEELRRTAAPPPSGTGTASRARPAAGAPATAGAVPLGAGASGAPWHGWVRVGVAVAAAAGLWYWPWPGTCGAPLVGYTAAAGGVVVLGAWSAVGTWRHRQGALHLLSLLAMLWGGVLAAREALPRVGYAIPTADHPAEWRCTPAVPTAPAPAPAGGPDGGRPGGGPPAPVGAPVGAPAGPSAGTAARTPLALVRTLLYAA